jgi:para-aminobenzoate synthetase/4-amino-4-deoxychorismate lyase
MLDEIPGTGLGPFVRLDFDDESWLYSRPLELIETGDPARVRLCLDRLRGRRSAGFISYEAGYSLEPKLVPMSKPAGYGEPPLLWFGIFESVEAAPSLPPGETAWAGLPAPGISFDQYAAAVEEIRSNIADGEVYQVNFTFPCTVPMLGNPMALYAQLRTRARGNWSAVIFTGQHWLVSCSPELFFAAKDGRIRCRPMKGTAPPASDPEALRNDPKNRAENLMIVDLMRNDLSRVARPGTVKVPELFKVELYPTVLQMTSTVVGDLKDGCDAVDVLQTIFPCGSITGAPKIAAIERIHELERGETSSRGPYTGAIGHILENGDAEFNVAIRTLILKPGEKCARYNVGSAIVIDSDAGSEWEECLQKTAFIASPVDFQLLETFAFGPRFNPRVRRHLERLEKSARELQFHLDRTALEAELERIKRRLKSTIRLRISLDRSGTFHLERSALPSPPRDDVTVSIVPRVATSDDFRLYYKTSDRRFYDEARSAAGTFEVLFTDSDGFLTEGSFTNVFVRDGQRLLTPPLRRGLLPGVLRQDLIKRGNAIEQDLRRADLEAGFFVGNSLRGLVSAILQEN